MATVLRNARILTADDFRDDLAVVIEDGRIIALLPDAAPQLGEADEQVDLGGGWLLPVPAPNTSRTCPSRSPPRSRGRSRTPVSTSGRRENAGRRSSSPTNAPNCWRPAAG